MSSNGEGGLGTGVFRTRVHHTEVEIPSTQTCAPVGVGGGGGTDSLSLGTDLETTAPLFGHGQHLVCDLQIYSPLFS